LLSRTVSMIEKYFDGVLPGKGEITSLDQELIDLALEVPKKVSLHMDKVQYSLALAEIWQLVGQCNRYIDQTQPWVLGRSEEGKERLKTVLYILVECLRFVAVQIAPVMPQTPEKIFHQLGITEEDLHTFDSLATFGQIKGGTTVKKGEAIFPRIDIKKELEFFTPGEKEEKGKDNKNKKIETKGTEELQDEKQITIADFDKLQLKVATVLACEKVEKSDKLLKFRLRVGSQERNVVSGIAQYYSPEELVGKKVILLANLKPAKIRGEISQGMLLSAATEGDGELKLLTVDGDIIDGADIS
ncbi:MAG: methionine--tRNA ligase subunit beta, partial [Clostridiales bacterium]|nr:methionine--tRNA ligase subunit beta [Clostridiales bacterium]